MPAAAAPPPKLGNAAESRAARCLDSPDSHILLAARLACCEEVAPRFRCCAKNGYMNKNSSTIRRWRDKNLDDVSSLCVISARIDYEAESGVDNFIAQPLPQKYLGTTPLLVRIHNTGRHLEHCYYDCASFLLVAAGWYLRTHLHSGASGRVVSGILHT